MQTKNKILIVAAHPDDEVLGCGGTIAKHKKSGDTVSILILGDGITSRTGETNITQRENQAQKSAKILGIDKLLTEKLPDNKFDTVPLLEIAKIVEKAVNKTKPEIIYTHFSEDLNVDHRLTLQAVLTACRPQPGFCVKKILSFEILSSTEWQEKTQNKIFCPTEYNNITNFIDKKIKALDAYKNELKPFPHPRSKEGVKILAQYRGMEVGYKYAEAFQIIRNIKT